MAKQVDTKQAARVRGDAEIPVDLYRAFVFPNRMREQRQRHGYPKLLSFAVSIPEIPYIRLSKIERGEVVARPDELRRIAKALDIPPADLLLDIDAPRYDVAHWAEPFFDPASVDLAEERFAVLLGSALRARRSADPALTIAALDRDFNLPAVNLSRIENARKPFSRWNAAIQGALYAVFGVPGEAALRDFVAAEYRRGALDGFLALTADPSGRHERSRARIAELATALAGEPRSQPVPDAPPRPTPLRGPRLIPVHGVPLAGGLIGDIPTGESIEAPRPAGPRTFALRVDRASLGGGMPAKSTIFADPDRYPLPGGLAVLREGEGWRLLAIASGRDGRMMGYSTNPDIERPLDDCDPATVAAVIAAAFI